MKALCVFTDPGDTRLAWLLRPGFRHVFACLNDGAWWTMFDPRDGCAVVQTIQGADYDLRGDFEAQGYVVVETEQGPPIRAPMIVSNCVGLTKAILCIRAPFVQTPYGLYKHLIRTGHAHG